MTIFEKGKKIYKRLKAKLIKKYKGKILAIEPDSGKYIIGEDELDAALKAQHQFPGKIFDFFRIGYAAVHKFRRKIPIYFQTEPTIFLLEQNS